jgi:hypothetical protein
MMCISEPLVRSNVAARVGSLDAGPAPEEFSLPRTSILVLESASPETSKYTLLSDSPAPSRHLDRGWARRSQTGMERVLGHVSLDPHKYDMYEFTAGDYGLWREK